MSKISDCTCALIESPQSRLLKKKYSVMVSSSTFKMNNTTPPLHPTVLKDLIWGTTIFFFQKISSSTQNRKLYNVYQSFTQCFSWKIASSCDSCYAGGSWNLDQILLPHLLQQSKIILDSVNAFFNFTKIKPKSKPFSTGRRACTASNHFWRFQNSWSTDDIVSTLVVPACFCPLSDWLRKTGDRMDVW